MLYSKVLFILSLILFSIISSQIVLVKAFTNSSDSKSNSNQAEIDSFYYSYFETSAWIGYYKLEAQYYSDQTVWINYDYKNRSYLDSNDYFSGFFLFSKEFNITVQNVNWDVYSSMILNISNWEFNTSSGIGTCDGGAFSQELRTYSSKDQVVNNSIYAIDNDSCSGNRNIPLDSNVIPVMNAIKNYTIDLANANYPYKDKISINVGSLDSFFLFLSLMVLPIFVLRKRRIS